MKKSILSALIFCLVLISCGNQKPAEIANKYVWRYVDGYHVGDELIFKGGVWSIDKDNKVFKQGKQVGTLLKVSRDELIILSDKNEKGYYTIMREIDDGK
jgi:hypothetical protein